VEQLTLAGVFCFSKLGDSPISILLKNLEKSTLDSLFCLIFTLDSFSLFSEGKPSKPGFLLNLLLFLRLMSNRFSLYNFLNFFWLLMERFLLVLYSFVKILLLFELRLSSFLMRSESSFFCLLEREWEFRLSMVLNISILWRKVFTLVF
jgi:hypothetical protein